jgi:hypothetical protein
VPHSLVPRRPTTTTSSSSTSSGVDSASAQVASHVSATLFRSPTRWGTASAAGAARASSAWRDADGISSTTHAPTPWPTAYDDGLSATLATGAAAYATGAAYAHASSPLRAELGYYRFVGQEQTAS